MSKTKFEVSSPMHEGPAYLAMQEALRQAGYTDYEDKPLSPNGKWGKRSQAAFDKLVADYAPAAANHTITISTEPLMIKLDGKEINVE